MVDYDLLLSGMGTRIIERRKQLNLTQEQLAEIADVSSQMISTSERGAKAIRPENILKLSDALNISTDYLLKGTKTEVDNSYYNIQIDNLTHKQRVALENIVTAFLDVCENGEDK